jgi:hypothetical protein
VSHHRAVSKPLRGHCWLHRLSSRDRRQRATEHLPCGPSATGSASCHRWRPLSIPRLLLPTISLSCLNQGHAQRGMRAHKVRIRPPPVHMSRAPWGVCTAVAHVRRARADTPWRIVRLTRSIKAVLTRPEKPKACKASVNAGPVPRRMTCLTRSNLRRR